MNETETLAEYACSIRYDSLPADVIALAKANYLDFLGCAVRGVSEPVVQLLAAELLERKLTAVTLLPGEMKEHAPTLAARVLATAGHAIDYDDTHPGRGAHISTPVFAALSAQAPVSGASGQDFIAAYVAGYEAAVRVGQLLDMSHYHRGFHTTGTVSVFGAAVGCAHLAGLDVAQTRAAMGLAATLASGIKCTFGTMAKPLNAGAAASNGLLAARLVARGVTAPESALEAQKGFLELYGGLEEAEREIAGEGCWQVRDNMVKLHAACHATHPLIYTLTDALAGGAIELKAVERVALEVAPLCLATASILEPRSRLDMKFSFPYVAAAVLTGRDTSSEDAFDTDALRDPLMQSLLGRISVSANESVDVRDTWVTLTMRDGQTIELAASDVEVPTDALKMFPQMERKFLNNTCSGLGDEAAQSVLRFVNDLESQPSLDYGSLHSQPNNR